MKTKFKSSIIAFGAIAIFSACDENSWNDKLDGFEEPKPGSKTETVEYTLTDADYTKIATKAPYTTYAKEHDQSEILALIGSNFSFSSEAEALEYIPIFLRDSTNNFFAMANGSAVKVTYDVAANIAADVKSINAGVETYNFTEEDYIDAYDSDEDYINAFCPAVPASRFIPRILKSEFPDAEAGDFAVVSYNQASENPIFGTIGGGDNPRPEWQMTSVLGTAQTGQSLDVRGIVTAINNRGFVLTDASGSILCYQASGFNTDNVAIGSQVSISAEVTAYGTALQFAITDDSYSVEGIASYTYPAPKVVTGPEMDQAIARTGDFPAEYVTITAKASVGSYTNFIVDGAETAQGSGYQMTNDLKALFTDGETYQITGYFVSVSGGRYYNIVITDVKTAAAAASAPSRAPVNEVTYTETNAVYRFDGSAWTVPADVDILQHSDYVAMGQRYDNLSGTTPATVIPQYLAHKYPYAVEGETRTVVYLYYADQVSRHRAVQYEFNGSRWDRLAGATTAQFVNQNGWWKFNPSVVITLPYVRNADPTYTYYMGCVNWVFEHIGKEMGGTSLTDSPFIDYRGNAEFYSGASAFYGNVDIRAVTARNNAPEGYTGYDGLTDDEVTLLIKRRFCFETMLGALEAMYPEMTPIEGVETTYTVNFTSYSPAQENTLVYVIVAPGKLKYKSCTWFKEGEDSVE